jgi:hypothetical protein
VRPRHRLSRSQSSCGLSPTITMTMSEFLASSTAASLSAFFPVPPALLYVTVAAEPMALRTFSNPFFGVTV